MKIIALDLGSNMALAHNGFEDCIIADHKEFKGIRAYRANNTLWWLDSRITDIQATCGQMDACVFERPFARGMDATRSLWGIAGIIEAIATFHGMAVLDLTPASIKQFITGKGSGKKTDMLAAACRLGYAGNNEHEADAYCLLQCALSTAAVTPPKKAKELSCQPKDTQTQPSSSGSRSVPKSGRTQQRSSSGSAKVLSAPASAKQSAGD